MRNLVIIAITATVLLLAIGLVIYSKSSSSPGEQQPDSSALDLSADSSTSAINSGQTTIKQQWQWQRVADDSNETDTLEDENLTPFTPQSVHDALQAVRVDANGNLILDHEALVSLDETLERMYKRLDAESLRQLQDMIRDALPGITGEQTAEIVEDYYNFLIAQQEFNQIYEANANPNRPQTVATIESDEALYGELQALRELYLGPEKTASLFRVSDANAQFMFDNMKLDLDQSLTPQERASRRQQIREQWQLVTEANNIDSSPSDEG